MAAKKKSGGGSSAAVAAAATAATAGDRKGKGKAVKTAAAAVDVDHFDVLPANRNLVVPKGRPVRVYADGALCRFRSSPRPGSRETEDGVRFVALQRARKSRERGIGFSSLSFSRRRLMLSLSFFFALKQQQASSTSSTLVTRGHSSRPRRRKGVIF